MADHFTDISRMYMTEVHSMNKRLSHIFWNNQKHLFIHLNYISWLWNIY